jgi:hypothetical protein
VHAPIQQDQFKQHMTAIHAAAVATVAAASTSDEQQQQQQQQQQSAVLQTRPSHIYGPEFVLRAIVAVTPTMQVAIDHQAGKLARTDGKQ